MSEENKIQQQEEIKKEEVPQNIIIDNKDKDAKQEYLTKELIDKGYNPEDLSNYVSRTKGYTIEEIGIDLFKKLIEEFKTDQLKKASEFSKAEKEREKQEEASFDPKLYKAVTQTITCAKQELSPLAEKDKIIQIISPQKVEGGVFTPLYYTYQVSVEAIDSKTRRIFEDFVWLRYKLLAVYPNVLIPPLIEKNFFDVNDLPITHVRLRYLNRFFNVIIRKKILRTSPWVYSFLTLTQEDWETFKKKNKATVPYKSIEEHPTIKGTIPLNLTKEILTEADKVPIIIPPTVYRYERVNEVIELLMNDFIQTNIHMKQLSEVFTELSSISSKCKQGKAKTKGFALLGEITNQWSKSYLKQKDLFDFQFREFFDFMRREMVQLNDLANEYKTKRDLYENFEMKLYNKKENLFNSKKYPKWEIVPEQGEILDYPFLEQNKKATLERMCHKETEISKKQRNDMIFATQNALREYTKLMKYQDERMTRLINNLEKHNGVLIGDINNLMTLLKTKI